MTAPSGWKVEQALAAWQSARARILNDDADLGRDEAVLAELLGDETGSIDEIMARLIAASLHAKAMAEAAHEMIDGLRQRQARYANRADQFRGTLMAIMEAMGEKKRETPMATLTMGAGRASVQITDETALPDEYIRVTRSPDKAAITADLKQGVVIPGAELANSMPTLTIRSK
jgi:Siphovirus Gp157